jgi:cell division protein FtsX
LDESEASPPEADSLRLKAYGYILANARAAPLRTGATITAVAVAVAFLIVVSSLSVGLEGATQRELLDYTIGTPELPISDFVQTEEGDFVGLFATRLFDPSEVEDMLFTAQQYVGSAKDVKVYPYSERLMGRYHITGLDYLASRLEAVDPRVGLTTPYTSYHDYKVLSQGEHLDDPDAADVVLGYLLWQDRFPEAHVGDLIDLAPEDLTWHEATWEDLRSRGTVTRTLLPSLSGLRLRGVLDRDLSTDRNAYVPLGYFANETGAGHTVDGPRCEGVSVEVEVEGVDLEGLAEALRADSPRVSSFFIASSQMSTTSALAEGLRTSIYSWLMIATAVILVGMTLGVTNTSFLSVNQREREIGTLRALGLTRQQVRNLVQWEALFIGMMGWVIGFLSGIILANSILNVLFEAEELGVVLAPGRTVPWIVISSAIAVILAALVGAEVPARQAASKSPVEALTSPL